MFTEDIRMTEKDRTIVKETFEKLVENLTLDILIVKLVATKIITVQEQEELLMEVISHKRAEALLRLLLNRNDEAFYVLQKTLQQYNMPHKLLEGAGTC